VTLTGVDPNNPRPAIRREYVFGAGPSVGFAPDRPVLLIGNKTSAGTEPVDVINTLQPIEDDADCKARAGARSELYAMYRKFAEVTQEARMYMLCPTESAGAAALVTFTISGASDASSGWEFHCHGETFTVSVETGSTQSATATAIANAFNGYDGGRLQVTAVAAIDGAGPSYKVTVTAAQKGPRGDQIIGATASRGLRVRALGANAQTVVKNTGSYAAGGAEDDWSAAITDITNGEYYYIIPAKYATVTLTANDNGLGELITMVKTQALPINGKDQQVHAALVGTQAQATAVAISSASNSVYAVFKRQENSDWSNAMLAAHCCAIVRQQEIGHPSANTNLWTATDNQICNIPAPFLAADYPSNGEIVADLNNGVSPIVYTGGRVVIERHVTSRSLNELGSQDYRAREGHIFSAVSFAWSIVRQRYEASRQPFADDDPVGNAAPPARHTTPGAIRALIEGVIDDLTSDTPLGRYEGAILRPSARQRMKDSIVVTYDGIGFPVQVDFEAVRHNINLGAKLRETGAAY